MKFSVILCTHNPRQDYLSRTLESLRRQSLPLEQWEFLLVDNASSEVVADGWDLSWHPNGRHIREEEVGLTAARLCGIRESKADVLIFVDDDNVLASDYLTAVHATMRRFTSLGAFGAGELEPEYEVKPRRELAPYLERLALRTVPAARWTNDPMDFSCLPWGAGLCVTRQVAEGFVALIEKLRATAVLGRRGQQLFSGEDDVFSWVAIEQGLSFGIFPELRITHLIGAKRLTRRYFRQLIHDHAFSHGVLKYLLVARQPTSLTIGRYAWLMLHLLRNGLFSMQCQLAQSKGYHAAKEFIHQNRLQPVGHGADLARP